MSASREKRQRRELREAELNSDIVKKSKSAKKVSPRMAQARKIKIRNAIGTAIAVLFVLAFALLIFVNCGFLQKNATAVTIGDHKLSPAEYDYFYVDSYNTYLNNYASYIQYGMMSAPDEDTIKEYALNNATQCYALYDAAQEAGFQLEEDAQASLDSARDSIEENAKAAGFKNGDDYLEANYGKGSTVDSYMEYATVQAIAYAYSNEKGESFAYTDADLRTYYDEHVKDFDKVTYRVFDVTGDDAKDTADAMAAELDGTEDSFVDAAKEYAPEDAKESYEEDTYTLRKNATYAGTSTDYADWVFGEDRIAGESQVFATTSGYSVVMFVSRDRNDYNKVNVRHILVQVETSGEDGTSTDADWEACKAKIDEIEGLWLDSDGTEDAFAELANEHSTDGGSNTKGGLYTDVHKGQMVEEFENWCFDESRQVGDTGIVKSTYGYHLMYYSGTGDEYWKDLADSQKRDEDYEAWYTDFSANYEAKTSWFGMLFTDIPEAE